MILIFFLVQQVFHHLLKNLIIDKIVSCFSIFLQIFKFDHSLLLSLSRNGTPKVDTSSSVFFFLLFLSLFLFSFSLFFFLVSFSLPLSFKVENHIYDIAMQELNNMVDENDFEKFKRRIEDYGLPIEIIGKLVS